MDNIFYFRIISSIGGTETFLYEIAKKYNVYDITVMFDSCDEKQFLRLSQYVKCIKRDPKQVYECNKLFLNFNNEALENVKAKEYIFVSHANYEALGYTPPIRDEKITKLVGVSKFSTRKITENAEKIGKKCEIETCYNPLTIEKNKLVKLVACGRFDDHVKGASNLVQVVKELDKYAEEHNRTYILFVFTNVGTELETISSNVHIMKPRLDIRPFIKDADYLLSPNTVDMETYGYSINESLCLGTPIVATPLTILEELPITDNEYIRLEWDLSNIKEVVKDIFEKKVKPFKYTPPEDRWEDLLVKTKSNYTKSLKDIVEVRTIRRYYDLQLKEWKEINGIPFKITRQRYEYLNFLGLVKLCEQDKENVKIST